MARIWIGQSGVVARTHVIDIGAALSGFCIHEHGQDGLYVASLHVVPEARGTGAGRALMARCAALSGQGALWLEVLMGNHAARAIYRHWAGVESAAFIDEMLGEKVESCRVTWADARSLANRLGGLPL